MHHARPIPLSYASPASPPQPGGGGSFSLIAFLEPSAEILSFTFSEKKVKKLSGGRRGRRRKKKELQIFIC